MLPQIARPNLPHSYPSITGTTIGMIVNIIKGLGGAKVAERIALAGTAKSLTDHAAKISG
jgi:hypothetical protein